MIGSARSAVICVLAIFPKPLKANRIVFMYVFPLPQIDRYIYYNNKQPSATIT
ncbi:hypothetical protein D3C84_1296950 [compost metagenome]